MVPNTKRKIRLVASIAPSTGERPRPRTAKQHSALKVKLQQEVDRVETGIGLQENRGQFQGVLRVIRMKVWGLGRDRDR